MSTVESKAVEFEVLAEGLRFPEGPVVLPDGSLAVVEIERGTLTRIDTGGGGSTDVIAQLGGGPNGAAMGPDGAVYITNNGGCFGFIDLGAMLLPGGPTPASWEHGSIQRVDLATGDAEVVYTEHPNGPLRAPNDLVFDRHGGFWFTDHGVRHERSSDRTGVMYAKPDGSSITEVVFPLDAPNGVGLSPDGERLYVAETPSGRVFWWRITAPGEAAAGGPLFAGGTLLGAGAGVDMFDSLAVDGDGWVCVATIGNGGITAFAPDGSAVEHYPLPDPVVTNIAFGGPDHRTAYVTLAATGKVVAFEWPRPGLALAH